MTSIKESFSGTKITTVIDGHADRVNGEPVVCSKISILGQMLTESLTEYLGEYSEKLKIETADGYRKIEVDMSGMSFKQIDEILMIFGTVYAGIDIVKDQFPDKIIIARESKR